MENRFAAEKKLMMDDALNKLHDKYNRIREDMLRRHEEELAGLEVTLASLCLLLCPAITFGGYYGLHPSCSVLREISSDRSSRSYLNIMFQIWFVRWLG